MSYETNHLNYCPVGSDNRIHNIVQHALIYPLSNDSIDKEGEIKEPYCKHCLKTESLLKREYGEHLEELHNQGLATGYQSGLNH